MRLKFTIAVFTLIALLFCSAGLVSAASPVRCNKMLDFGYVTADHPHKTFTAGEGDCFINNQYIVKIARITNTNYRKNAVVQLYDKYSYVGGKTLTPNSIISQAGFQAKLTSIGGSSYFWRNTKYARFSPAVNDWKWPTQDVLNLTPTCEKIFTMDSTKTQQTFDNIGARQCIDYGNYRIKLVGAFYSPDPKQGGKGIYVDLFKKQGTGYVYKKSLLVRYLKQEESLGGAFLAVSIRSLTTLSTGKLEFEGLTVEPLRNYKDTYYSPRFGLKVSFTTPPRETGPSGTVAGGHPLEACRYDYNGDGVVNNDDTRPISKYNGKRASSRSCYVAGTSICRLLDGNKDGIIDIKDITPISAYFGKECPLSMLDYDGNGKIEYFGGDATKWSVYATGGSQPYNRICTRTDQECLKFDLNADYKVTFDDYYLLSRYNGKTVTHVEEISEDGYYLGLTGAQEINPPEGLNYKTFLTTQANFGSIRLTLRKDARAQLSVPTRVYVHLANRQTSQWEHLTSITLTSAQRNSIQNGNTIHIAIPASIRNKVSESKYLDANRKALFGFHIFEEEWPASARIQAFSDSTDAVLLRVQTPTAPSGQSPTTCTDSDGGLNYYVKGTTRKGEVSYTDWCNGSKQLKEFYCSGNNIRHWFTNCYYGCRDGRCLSGQEAQQTTTEKPNLKFKSVDFKKENVVTGEETLLYADVRNTGATTNSQIFVTVRTPLDCTVTKVINSVFNGLYSNKWKRATFGIKCFTPGTKRITVYIDGGTKTNGIIDESNENDNSETKWLTVTGTSAGTGHAIRTTGFASKQTFVDWLRSLIK